MAVSARICVLAAVLAGGFGFAQDSKDSKDSKDTKDTKASSAPAKKEKPPVYVRRASAGVSLSVLVLTAAHNRSDSTSTTSPAVATNWDTTARKQRVGYGITTQVRLTNRFAVVASPLFRKFGYEMTTIVTKGTVATTATATTTTTTTTTNEDTRATFIDVPVAVRFYTKSALQPGPRVFFDAGGVMRNVTRIRTGTNTTGNDGVLICCTNTTPATPSHRSVRGAVAGFGVQLIDPVGIRVVPEVRYTRWLADTFNAYTTRTQRNQIEATISLTF